MRRNRELSDATQRRYEQALKSHFDAQKKILRDYSALSHSARIVLSAALTRIGQAELAQSITLPKRSRKDVEIPPEAELKTLELKLAKLNTPASRVIALTLTLGLRSFEILNLTREQVSDAVSSGVLRVTRKGAYEGNVAMNERAKTLFTQLLKDEPKHPKRQKWQIVLELLSKRATFAAAYNKFWRDVRDVTGHPPHWLRHALATRMIRRKAPLSVVQKQLGHLSPTTTMRYAHASLEDIEEFL